MTNFYQRLEKVAQQPDIFQQLNRGVERETLRYHPDGVLAETPHPPRLGSALKNQWITTDYGESLLEFITPVSNRISDLMAQLEDIHHFARQRLNGEYLWPMSMPCYVGDEDKIALAQYGTSNSGRLRHLYRHGLKNRYGSLMQIISGVHFNFSFPESFWDALHGEQPETERQDTKSAEYFGLIRNYYRFGWLIPYFFGASSALCPSFVRGREGCFPFEHIGKILYLPHATSLRLSDLGYTNHAQSSLKIRLNSLDEYLTDLGKAIRTPSESFEKIGVKVDGEYRQLNSNVLQIENELYAPIRPKRVVKGNEHPSDALKRGGVEYIEVRALDVNPFSPVGITEDQVRFLDMFLIWAALSPSDAMTQCEMGCWRDNWEKVVLEGRKPDLELQIGCHGEVLTLNRWAKRVFAELKHIAILMDSVNGDSAYQDVWTRLSDWIDAPEKTLSAQLLQRIQALGSLRSVVEELRQESLAYSDNYQYQYYSEQFLEEEVKRSIDAQHAQEAADTVDFDTFLEQYFSYLHDD